MVQEVQEIAKKTIIYLSEVIKSGMTEKEIADMSDDYMRSLGIDSFWYHGVGSLVLVGKRTLISKSAKEYIPSNQKVRKNDLVTVDLSPEIDRFWGDYARSFSIENGKFTMNPKLSFLKDGIRVENEIHEYFLRLLKPQMSFEEAHFLINNRITEMGYENLDFHGNFGHTIEKKLQDRIYIEKGSKIKFSEVDYFTFEPHIRKMNGEYGFKREDIYFFTNGNLKRL